VNHDIQKFSNNDAVASAFAKEFVSRLQSLTKTNSKVTVALSGGSTPKVLFQILAKDYSTAVDWSKVHFFWGDERCVAPDDEQSNFGEANRLFLAPANIPDANVHRVAGESAPEQACQQYIDEITQTVRVENGIPVFDIVLLGMGADGHTASIFPHEIELLNVEEICAVATHPESGQKRISITGKVINAADKVYFLITGASKAPILAQIFQEKGEFESYPTYFIRPSTPPTFYIDDAAGAEL
jgi:6-phosphogluconolactonase